MNKVILAAVAAVLAGLGFPRPASAEIEYPWCAYYGGGSDDGGGTNCGFVSWEQCMETARGMGNDCRPNPFYKGPIEPAGSHQAKPPDGRNRAR